MMMNLFSVFDPVTYFGMSFNWMIMIIIIILMLSKLFLLKSGYFNFYSYIYLNVNKLFTEISFPKEMFLSIMCVIMFIYLSISNLMGLFPLIFTSTAHPIMTMGFGLIMWMSFFLMGWIKNFKNSMIHLVPQGSPLLLSFLMVLIESISHLIRPFTLSIRLAANMMAGHLIVGLLSSISLMNMSSMMLSLIFQSILLILEFGVAVIQGFVFSILLLLYALDYY